MKSLKEFAEENGISQVTLMNRRAYIKTSPYYVGHGRWEYTDADLARLLNPRKKGRPCKKS